jgi:hypothetical protein
MTAATPKHSVLMIHTQLLDELLVAVELLECLNIARVDLKLLSNLAMDGITEDAELQRLLAWHGQADRTTETLVTLRIVVLERDLELDSLSELSLLLAIGESEDVRDGLLEDCWWDFAVGTKLQGELNWQDKDKQTENEQNRTRGR